MKIQQKDHNNQAIAVILGYYNGNAYLSEQVHSILQQSHKNVHIFIFDDHSPDPVDIEKLHLSPEESAKITIQYRDKNLGFVQNFLEALREIEGDFDYFSFSDQDDIWLPQKLQKALESLSSLADSKPCLYCGRTIIADETGQSKKEMSPLFQKKPHFANALVQSIGGGNTMLFNKAARNIIVQSTFGVEVVSHDWWCYQIISGVGGTIIYDDHAYLYYRQHAQNIVGSNNSFSARLFRVKGLLQKKMYQWNEINFNALLKNKALLTQDNQKRLEDVCMARKSFLLKRLYLFWRGGVYRQTFIGNLGLYIGVILNKV